MSSEDSLSDLYNYAIMKATVDDLYSLAYWSGGAME